MGVTASIDRAWAIDVALGIGFDTARAALWSGERCTWLDPLPRAAGALPTASATCGADIYSGTAGIGLFLAQLAAHFADPLLRRTARGAFAQTIARAETMLASAPHGYYGGAAGIAAALVVGGRALGDEPIWAAGHALLAALFDRPAGPAATDMISGLAGSIAACVEIAPDAVSPQLVLDQATAWATQLIGFGERSNGGALSWRSLPDCRANLTGFAHGASGVAHSLLVLAATTRDARVEDAAKAALAYEALAFEPGKPGWPDYRAATGSDAALFYPVAWCHGAAGIMATRLTALRLGLDVRRDIDAATAMMVDVILNWNGSSSDLSLCHGFVGILETLLDHPDARDDIAEAASTILLFVNHVHGHEREWPSGLPSREETHGLMLGKAGIGHFLLRVACPTVASVLRPGESLVPVAPA